jgi:D-alanyl-D-alanine carboxypeptidase (penicillin-binding protein 5/6)
VHGLPPSEGQEPDVTTARDLAILCRELAKRPEALKYTGTLSKGFREDKFIMRNHNKLLTQVAGCDGFKTGYFQAAGFSIAATAKKGGVRIIALVMGSKDRKVRDAKAGELLAKGFTIVPPKPELMTASSSLSSQRQQVASVSKSVQPSPALKTTTESKIEDADAHLEPVAAAPSATSSGWSKFFIGLGAGFALFLGFFVVAGFLMKRRTRILSKYKNRP